MKTLFKFDTSLTFSSEADVETHSISSLKSAGYEVSQRKCKDVKLNKHWPSKTTKAKGVGFPDVLLRPLHETL